MERRKAFIPRFSTKKVVLREKMSRPQESESSPQGGARLPRTVMRQAPRSVVRAAALRFFRRHPRI